MPKNHAKTSINTDGEVGVMKALYFDYGIGYELVWSVPGKGVFKNTTWSMCEIEGMPPMAGLVLIP